MSVTPTLRIDSDGRVYALSGADLSTGNAVLITRGDHLFAVPVENVGAFLPGWQNLSALQVAEVVAGMPGGG